MVTDITARLQEVQQWLQKEFAGVRSGQATPGLLDSISVESYGAKVPLNQVGNVGVEDARTLRISTWDADSIPQIESAIRDAELGVSVSTDSAGLRVVFPELTSERREQMLKLAKNKLEDARISVRSIRDEAMKEIDKTEKAGDISEDEKFTQKEQIQKEVESTNKALETLFTQKETELQS